MTRYICPKCGQFFYYRLERCPHCNVKFKYPEVKKEEKSKIEEAPVEEVDSEETTQKIPDETVETTTVETINEEVVEQDIKEAIVPLSYFDGRLIQLIGYSILSFLICVLTLFIAFPWATCMTYRWQVKHMVVDGKRLSFDGNGAQLFGTYIKWILLSVVTLMIYSLWIPIKVLKWKTKHTHFIDNK